MAQKFFMMLLIKKILMRKVLMKKIKYRKNKKFQAGKFHSTKNKKNVFAKKYWKFSGCRLKSYILRIIRKKIFRKISENFLEWFFCFIFQPCGMKLSQVSLNYTINNAMSKLLLDYREGSGSYYKKWIYFDIS